MNRLFLLLIMIMGTMGACTSSDDEGAPVVSSIILSADKMAILANGVEQVTFTVKDGQGNDITNSCQLRINGTEQSGYVFSTTEPAVYKVKASTEGVESNEIEVAAVRENVKLEMKSDKQKLMADGGDLINLSLMDEDGNNVTEMGEFYANGKKIEGTIFKTMTAGEHKITAVWNGKEVEGILKLSAFSTIPFVDRVLVEDLTGTDCQYCYRTIKELTPLAKENFQVVLVSVHISGSQFDNKTNAGKDGLELKKEMGATGTPSVYLDRIKTKWRPEADGGVGISQVTDRIKTEGELAIAIENTIQQGEVKVRATIASVKTFTGKVTAVIVENGIIAYQTEMGNTEMHQMMRDYVPGVNGESINIKAGELTNYETSIPISGYVQKNCRLIVFVINADGLVENVQQTPLGINIGY